MWNVRSMQHKINFHVQPTALHPNALHLTLCVLAFSIQKQVISSTRCNDCNDILKNYEQLCISKRGKFCYRKCFYRFNPINVECKALNRLHFHAIVVYYGAFFSPPSFSSISYVLFHPFSFAYAQVFEIEMTMEPLKHSNHSHFQFDSNISCIVHFADWTQWQIVFLRT